MPNSADLVTDLPADFNVFGQGVDTSMQFLLGGTTGQVLSKTSATNMAFTWITPTDQTPLTTKGDLFSFTTVDARLAVGANETRLVADSVQATGLKYVADTTNYVIAAKADLLVGTAADTVAALTVGTNGQVLTADSTVSPTGLKWATPAAGGKVLQVVSANITTDTTIASTTYTDTNLTATITPTLNTSKILVIFSQQVRLSSSSTSVAELGLKLLRGVTTVADLSQGTNSRVLAVENSNPTAITAYIGYNYLDSPATTSATTYKVQAALPSTASGRSSRFQIQDIPSVITLMEIGA